MRRLAPRPLDNFVSFYKNSDTPKDVIEMIKAIQETMLFVKNYLQNFRRSSSNSAVICLNDPFWANRAHLAASKVNEARISASIGSSGDLLSNDRVRDIVAWYESENDFAKSALAQFGVLEHADMPDSFYSNEGIAWKYVGELLRHTRAQSNKRRDTMNKKHTEYCYSWDGEDFKSDTFGSVKAAMADAAIENDGEHGVVYIGKVSRPDNSMFFPDAADVIEHMAEQADDYGGEHAFDYPDVSDEARAELTEQLETLLNDWCEKHGVAPTFYQVADIKEYPIPATTE